MNVFSFLFIFFFLILSIISSAQVPPGKAIYKTKEELEAKTDTSFQYFLGRHPTPKRQCLYFEIFGNAANFYSINYEVCIFQHKLESDKWNRIGIRVGINYSGNKYAVPLMIQFSNGVEKYFEAGAGWVPWYSNEKRVDGIAGLLGFRFQPVKAGLMARAGLTPTYLIQEKRHWRMIFGFSIGYAF